MPVENRSVLPDHKHRERSFYHFSSLKDIRIHGIYHNSLAGYLNLYSYTRNPHYHDFYSILFISEGSGSLTICNEEINVQQNSVVLIAPNQLHSFKGLDNTGGTVFFFCQDFYLEEFSFVRLLKVFSYVSQGDKKLSKPEAILTENDIKPLVEILGSIQLEYKSCNQPSASAVIIRSFLNILLMKISGIFESRIRTVNQSDNTFIIALSNLIESYFTREHKTGFYSAAFNLTEKHLNDICIRNFNCSLKKILHDRLMQESRKLLLSTELSVAEIAYKLNFEDNSYFNKVFRKSTELTPKKFRELHKKLLP